MRTRATLSGIFASVAILVVGWQAGSAAISSTHSSASSPPSTGTSIGAGTGATSGATASAAPTPSTSTPLAPAATTANGSFTGSSIDTQFGSVQVEVVVANGKIIDVKALHLTDDGGRSVQISNYAAPILRTEVIKSQSARVSTVGGATYTSDAYLTSAQAALDQAGI